MVSIDNLTLEEVYLAHAPSPAEVKNWLDTFLLIASEYADEINEYMSSAILMRHCSGDGVAFALNITMEPTANTIPIRRRLIHSLPAGHPLSTMHHSEYETSPSYILRTDSVSLRLDHLPRTKEMINTVKHCLSKTGWPMFDDVLRRLDTMEPCNKLYVSELARYETPRYNSFDSYPRNGACIERILTSVNTGVPASSIKVYSLRELSRLRRDEYTALPERIASLIPLGTYLRETPHLPVKGSNAGKIAYTENDKKGANDIQSVMKPGKYLRRVLKDKIENDQHLKEMVAEMIGSITPEFRTTRFPKEAAEVYMEGPSSCMSHGDERFHETIDTEGEWRHPIEALFFEDGSGDIELHYMLLNGRIAARALVNMADEAYPSSYIADWAGENGKTWFLDYLEKFDCDEDALRGCQIPRIELRNGAYLCPYIDHGNQGVRESFDDGSVFIIGGELQAPYEKGYVFLEPQCTCDRCDEQVPEDASTYIDHEDIHVCDGCLDCYPYALSEHGTIERMDEDNSIDLGFEHRHAQTRRFFNRIECGISQSTLNDAGLCEDINDDIRPMNDCTEVDGEWVPDDEISDDTDAPETSFRNISYVRIDFDVYDVEQCVWVEEDGRWEHGDDVDTDTYYIYRRNWFSIAERIEVDEDEAA
ncbi:hypothetical protein [Halomonas sp. 707B3]|uniref:hypothetical protein n=1 Tax=Halomonas sp. 707B3 TaxID=1681043 RepID=UPI00209FDF77|nr:hypothetical protein [Halomonas sp. 707B3]MCP1316872.1 hypothetical protein [Halomonas sp. 707B3]